MDFHSKSGNIWSIYTDVKGTTLIFGELSSLSLQVFTSCEPKAVFLLHPGASHAFSCKSWWEQDLRYCQHVALAGSFAAALPHGRTTRIRPSCFCPCDSQACKAVPVLIPVPRPSSGLWGAACCSTREVDRDVGENCCVSSSVTLLSRLNKFPHLFG